MLAKGQAENEIENKIVSGFIFIGYPNHFVLHMLNSKTVDVFWRLEKEVLLIWLNLIVLTDGNK